MIIGAIVSTMTSKLVLPPIPAPMNKFKGYLKLAGMLDAKPEPSPLTHHVRMFVVESGIGQ